MTSEKTKTAKTLISNASFANIFTHIWEDSLKNYSNFFVMKTHFVPIKIGRWQSQLFPWNVFTSDSEM